MKDFIVRLSSRKFLLVLATLGIVTAGVLTPEELEKAVAVVIAFIGAEGFADTAERFQQQKTKQTENNLKQTMTELGVLDTVTSDVDRSNITPGSDIPMTQ